MFHTACSKNAVSYIEEDGNVLPYTVITLINMCLNVSFEYFVNRTSRYYFYQYFYMIS